MTFFKLLPVQIILVAVGSLNSIIDGAVAGNLIGPKALTAIGLFWPVIMCMNMVTAVLSGGTSILCGQFMGKNQIDRSKSVFTLDILMVCAVSVLLTLAALLVPGGMSFCLGAREEITGMLSDYLKGYAFGFLPILLSSQLSTFLQSGKTGAPDIYGHCGHAYSEYSS